MNWITKKSTNKSTNADMMISAHKGKNCMIYRFGFYNFSYKRLRGQYIMLAKYKNRIYFKATDENTGFKLSDYNKNHSNCCFKARVKEMNDFIGEHELLFDDSEKLWYVEALR